MNKLDRFERQIEEELERGEWIRAKNYEALRKELMAGTKAVMKKKLLSIRLSDKDNTKGQP